MLSDLKNFIQVPKLVISMKITIKFLQMMLITFILDTRCFRSFFNHNIQIQRPQKPASNIFKRNLMEISVKFQQTMLTLVTNTLNLITSVDNEQVPILTAYTAIYYYSIARTHYITHALPPAASALHSRCLSNVAAVSALHSLFSAI